MTSNITLSRSQVAQHPANIRDASRALDALATSIKEIGILHHLIVTPVDQVLGHDFPEGVTHVVIDGNRRLAAAAMAGLTEIP